MRVAKSVAVDSRRDRSRLDFSAFRVLRRVLIDYLEVDAGECISIPTLTAVVMGADNEFIYLANCR